MNARVKLLAPLFLALASLAGWGCESIAPGLAEARAAAQDAKTAAVAAQQAAEASGDPEAIRVATEALEQANAADETVARVEAKALEWAAKWESGELGADEGAEMGGLLGAINPALAPVGTILGAVVGGWYYRHRARQIVQAIDAGKAAEPMLASAFGTESARKAIAGAMSPTTWKFVETQRN